MAKPINSEDVEILLRPIVPCGDMPRGRVGAITIKDQPYLVTILVDDAAQIEAVRFDGMHYETRTHDWQARFYIVSARSGECNCPHATFRREQCKHAQAAVVMGLISEAAGTYESVKKQEESPINCEADIPF